MTEAGGGRDTDGRDTRGMVEEKTRPAGPGETGLTRFGAEGDDTDGEGTGGMVEGHDAGGPAEGNALASGLQPGGTIPGGGPGTERGAIGTGGGSNDNEDTGTLRRWKDGELEEKKP